MSLKEKEQQAISSLRALQVLLKPEDYFYLAYSGGKDSDVIRILCELAGVKHQIYHNLTTVDAPETVRYVKTIKNVIINRPEKSMWRLIEDKLMPPTRVCRYCCSELKEKTGTGKIIITGVRKQESSRRKESAGLYKIIGKPKTTQKIAYELEADYRVTKQGGLVMDIDNAQTRQVVEHCFRTQHTMINPIVEWTDEDVWNFLKYYGCEGNPLYQEGFSRIGCIGCPMSRKFRYIEFARYPKYKELYIRAFDRMIAKRKEHGLKTTMWTSGEECFAWWMEEDPNQMSFLEDI